MNVSIENKVIWLAPECTGADILKEIFKNYGFFSCEEKNNFELKSLSNSSLSQDCEIPEIYNDFQIIANLRNPYDRVWSYYTTFYEKNYRPKEFEETKYKFNKFIGLFFNNFIDEVKIDSKFEKNNFFYEWSFKKITPNQLIRFENINEDVNSLDFVKKRPELLNLDFSDSEKHKNERVLSFDQMYDLESAQKVFNFYKKHFFSFGYDPFSFTQEVFTEEKKINFLHTYSLG